MALETGYGHAARELNLLPVPVGFTAYQSRTRIPPGKTHSC